MQRLPHAGRLPVAQPTPAGGAAAKAQLLRQQPPRGTRPEDEDDSAEHGPVGDTGAATLGLRWFSRQEGLDGLPEIIRDVGLIHDEAALWPRTRF